MTVIWTPVDDEDAAFTPLERSSLDDLADVDTDGAVDGQVLGYDDGEWVPVDQTGGAPVQRDAVSLAFDGATYTVPHEDGRFTIGCIRVLPGSGAEEDRPKVRLPHPSVIGVDDRLPINAADGSGDRFGASIGWTSPARYRATYAGAPPGDLGPSKAMAATINGEVIPYTYPGGHDETNPVDAVAGIYAMLDALEEAAEEAGQPVTTTRNIFVDGTFTIECILPADGLGDDQAVTISDVGTGNVFGLGTTATISTVAGGTEWHGIAGEAGQGEMDPEDPGYTHTWPDNFTRVMQDVEVRSDGVDWVARWVPRSELVPYAPLEPTDWPDPPSNAKQALDRLAALVASGGGGVSEAEMDAAIAAAIAGLIDGAPGALDTLNELAAALNDDASFAASVTTALAGKETAGAAAAAQAHAVQRANHTGTQTSSTISDFATAAAAAAPWKTVSDQTVTGTVAAQIDVDLTTVAGVTVWRARFVGRADPTGSASVGLRGRFNSDSGNNYSTGGAAASSSIVLGNVTASQTNTDRVSQHEIIWGRIASHWTVGTDSNVTPNSNGSTAPAPNTQGWAWMTTTAPTSFSLFPASGSFAVGSRLIVEAR